MNVYVCRGVCLGKYVHFSFVGLRGVHMWGPGLGGMRWGSLTITYLYPTLKPMSPSMLPNLPDNMPFEFSLQRGLHSDGSTIEGKTQARDGYNVYIHFYDTKLVMHLPWQQDMLRVDLMAMYGATLLLHLHLPNIYIHMQPSLYIPSLQLQTTHMAYRRHLDHKFILEVKILKIQAHPHPIYIHKVHSHIATIWLTTLQMIPSTTIDKNKSHIYHPYLHIQWFGKDRY